MLLTGWKYIYYPNVTEYCFFLETIYIYIQHTSPRNRHVPTTDDFVCTILTYIYIYIYIYIS